MGRTTGSLTAALARDVPLYIRSRAEKYLRSGRAAVIEWADARIAFKVQGSDLYLVGLVREEDAIVVSCTCPYFVDRGPCKHVWAAAVLIDQDPRWDGSWLQGDKLIDFESGIDDSDFDADVIDADEGEEFFPERAHPRGVWVPPAPSARVAPRKARKQPDPVTEAAQAAVNRLAELRQQLLSRPALAGGAPSQLHPIPPPGAQLIFILDAASTKASGMLMVHAATRKRAADGKTPDGPADTIETPEGTVAVDHGWSAAKPMALTPADVVRVADKAERNLVALLTSAAQSAYYGGYQAYGSYGESGPGPGYAGGGPFAYRQQPLAIPGAFHATVLPALCESGRAFLYTADRPEAYHTLGWDARPWTFRMEIVPDPEAPYPAYTLTGAFVRGDARLELNGPALILGSGYLVTGSGFVPRSCGGLGPPCAGYEAGPMVSPLDTPGGFWWAANLRKYGPMRIPREKADEVLAEVLSEPALPPLDVPDELRFDEPDVVPVPVLTLRPDEARPYAFEGTLEFDYAGVRVARGAAADTIYRPSPRSLIRRKREAEAAAEEALTAHRVRFIDFGPGRAHLSVSFKTAPSIVRDLLPKGWRIDVEGKPFRVSGDTAIEVASGIDWFDIHGSVDFGGVPVPLPELLAAVKRGHTTIVLPDQSIGVLTDEWVAQYGGLSAFAGAGTGPGGGAGAGGGAGEGGMHVRRSQLGLVDALLLSREGVTWSGRALEVRDRLRSFEGIAAADAPATFVGTLRGYQRLGLGWLRFLQELELGGCLADDMGLGKTVTVLALLEARRTGKNGAPRASLVVAPRSLLFNWKREAERFAPALRVAEYHGSGRDEVLTSLDGFDLVLTTYGTMRRDAAALAGAAFDYVILDEAQAIKNAATASAKATRLLRARHRLALSGTPIENQLGDLWSLFEFLNPGLLGSLQHGLLARARKGDAAALDTLRRGLRPYILRRTKQQVAPELPARNEDTMVCELEPVERKLYNQLRDHYRQAVLGLVDRQGLKRSQFQILEALLRLRQAACHPGLIDPRKHTGSSAKLDALIERLDEARAEGHKALVFSQFTSFLAFVRRELDERGVAYEYLDGQTRDRERRVARFQQDASCPLFLVSLKAGGLGLNLTAADYVFLLDPWWNPAVEAQAIDRAHRIGQERPVFAYRLIAADTVEERIIELQARKRQLADAIISADNSGLAGLTREDLELLLG
ncbi:MAG: DEAD/DEAH box helicase [Vicinamibacterales bacterium]